MEKLTEVQFEAADATINNALRSARKGTPEEKAAAQAVSDEWESAIAMPNRTFDERAARLATIAAVAVKYGLV
jgi:hypothetical protein